MSSFWITNGTVKIKLLNDQVRSFTREVDFSALTHQGLAPTEINKLVNSVTLISLYKS